MLRENLSNDALVINQVSNVVPSENILLAPNFDAAFLDKIQLLMKAHKIAICKPTGSVL